MTDWKTWDPWDLNAYEPQSFEIDGVTLILSCTACPEAYDAKLPDGSQLGYLRLRGGHFYAVYPDVGGAIVYDHRFNDPWQGAFSPEERQIHLPAAVKALIKKHEEHNGVRS